MFNNIEPRSKIKKVSHQINKDLSSPVSNSKMVELSLITTSKRNPPSIWSSDLEVEVWVKSELNQPSLLLPENTRSISKSAESAMLDSHQRLSTAERESVAITVTSDQRSKLRAEHTDLFYKTHQEI